MRDPDLNSRMTPEKLEVLEYLLKLEGAEPQPVPTIRPRTDPSPPELSFAQQRLWFLEQMQSGSSNAYNMSAALRLEGRLDVDVLARSLNEVVRRHDSLRTTFETHEGRPVQAVAPELVIDLPVVELELAARSELEERARLIAEAEALKPFDLARGPLLRVSLLKLGETEYVLLVNLHHIISDGWSIGIFVREMATIYEALLAGRPHDLPELPIQYPDFACWQRESLRGEVRERELAYWRDRLGGDPPVLDLPTDRSRPPVQSLFRGASRKSSLSRKLADALEALAQNHGGTLFMVLLAAFKVLVHRLSGQDDVLVGTPVAGRDRREVEGLIGCFLNTLVLRSDLSGNPTFGELVDQVREVALGAYAHQQVPFEMLLSELQPERDPSRPPLFQVFFNMLNFPHEELVLPGLTVEHLALPEIGSKFDFTIYAEADAEGIELRCTYNTVLFDEERIDELLAQYRLVLEQVAEDPAQPIDHLSLATPKALSRLPDPRADLDGTWRGAVHEVFARQARRRPERPAVRDPHESWTYRELAERSHRLARWLVSNGIRPGEVVAVYAHRSAPLIWSLLGVLEAGAAFLVLDPAYPEARLLEMARLARVRGFLRVESAGDLPETLARLAESPSVRCRLDLPRKSDGEAAGFLAGLSADPVEVAVGPDELAYIGFTSGSTGTPKGILGRHGPLSHFVPWQRREFGFGEEDVFSLVSGLSHDPLQREIFTALQVGAAITVPDPKLLSKPGYLAEWMHDEGVTVAHLTPAMAELLAASRFGASARIPSLRKAFFVGDVLTRHDVAGVERIAPRVTCINHYGAMETERALSYFVVPPAGPNAPKNVIPLGRGIPDVQLLVLNRDRGMAGVGELGVIHFRSPHLARGYLDDPALTEERFLVNPFTSKAGDLCFRTSDVGRYLPDGSVAFVGREDSQVILRGFRIETGEIETRLREQAEVGSAVVVLREDRPGDRRLVAYLTGAEGARPTVAELREHLSVSLPEFMIPSAFVFLDALPLNPNGKVDRRKLPPPDKGRPALETAYQEPRSELERTIAAVWGEVLGLDRVGLADRFFELGGHSLKLVEVQAKLEERLGVDLPLPELFNHSTVETLARYLSRQQDNGSSIPQIEERVSHLGAGKARLRQRLVARRRHAMNSTTRIGMEHV